MSFLSTAKNLVTMRVLKAMMVVMVVMVVKAMMMTKMPVVPEALSVSNSGARPGEYSWPSKA